MIDYHVHTYLCDHASGTPGDYIEKALEAGLFEIGFSDHAPLLNICGTILPWNLKKPSCTAQCLKI
jgi:histidinol phosphatase-like PHP family hydrolase